MWKRATVGLVPFHFSALPACGDYLRIGNRMFRAPSCGTCPSQLAFAFLICRKRSIGALQHLAVGRRSTQQVQTNRVKSDVLNSKLRFNCVSTRPKAWQIVRLLLRLLQETRQCFARTFVRCKRTIRYCRMWGMSRNNHVYERYK
jgi:hypothetical protein